MRFAGQWQEFISAEAGSLPQYNDLPVIVVSFGGDEGPVNQFVLSLSDARALVEEVLSALVDHGDTRAQEIFDRYHGES